MSSKPRLEHNKYNREWSQNNRNTVNRYHKNWREKRLRLYFKLKEGKKCVLCSESHPACLDFHHKNPKIKTDLVRQLALRFGSDEIVIKEVQKCVILCANCHRKAHWHGKS